MKKIIFIIVLALLFIQFIRIDKTNPSTNPQQDYIHLTQAPAEVGIILKRACYDCHSNEVKYPWYTNIAPVSWYIKGHVNDGREYVNFSEFGKYNQYQKEYIYKGLPSVIRRGSMPLGSYVWLHKEAELSEKDKKMLLEWFDTFPVKK